MDIISLTRQLGAAIQKDERYLAFIKARETNENDPVLNDLMTRIQLVQMNYQMEASKETPDHEKMAALEAEFNALYEQFTQNENMQAYDEARSAVDGMMNYIMQILGLCVNGADPETCEPEQHDHSSCGGSCSECSGCH